MPSVAVQNAVWSLWLLPPGDIVASCAVTVLHDNAGTATADWDATLKDLWQELQNKTGKLTGKQVQDNSDVATAASCSLLVKPEPNSCCK